MWRGNGTGRRWWSTTRRHERGSLVLSWEYDALPDVDKGRYSHQFPVSEQPREETTRPGRVGHVSANNETDDLSL